MIKPIYLDYAATTPVDPTVAKKMTQYLMPGGIFGNASSTHVFGQEAKRAIEEARHQVAQSIHAASNEIIFTSGATESDNLAIKGIAKLYQQKGKHIVTLKTEHSAVLDSCQHLEKEGFCVTYLSPESNGLLDLEKLRIALRPDTILVSIMHVNNEIGVIQDIDSIAQIIKERDILFHVDAAQSIGKVAINIKQIPLDLVSLSSHKSYGPKGIGALYIRSKPRVRVGAQIHGGGHESGMRSGTLAIHQIVGMGEAFQLAIEKKEQDYQKISALKKYFYEALHKKFHVRMNGDEEKSVPHILNCRFKNIKADHFIKIFPEIAVSKGSACHSKGEEPSYVLRELGLTNEEANHSLRFSFGRYTTKEELEEVIKRMGVLLEV